MNFDWVGSGNFYNILSVLVTIVVIVVLGLFAIRKGWVTFQGSKLSIGKVKESERIIIKRQFEYIDSATLDFFKDSLVRELVKDIFERTIIFNHIRTSGSFVKTKQLAVWSTICKANAKNIDKDETDAWTKKCLKELLDIRKEGEKYE